MNLEPGHVIDGKYRIVRLLGAGGMGAVYEGENARIRRKVAIKMLHGNVSSQAEAVQRFEREAQAAGRIGSEHICEVLDLGVLPDGTRYMVMEYLDGENMSGRITKLGRLTPLQAVPLLTQILDGLTAAHAAGIIHRDLKPDNIWITPQKGGMKDFVKILDFGVSKFSQIGGDEMGVTRAGAVVGTPYYMSPEQARGMSQVDARTDIYAIGVLLYQATTGQVPYQAETFNELLFKIVLEQPPPPQTYAPDLDPDFSTIIQRAMAREPQQRYQSCAEFKDALLAYQAAKQRGGAPAQAQQHAPNAGVGGTMMLDQNLVGSAGGAQQSPLAGRPPMQSGQQSPSGQNWSAGASPAQGVVVGGPPNNTSTTNAWGNASGAPAIPKSNTGALIAVIAVAVVLGGGGVAAFMLRGGSKTNASGGDKTTEIVAPPSATTAAQPSATAPVQPPAPPTAEATVAPTATASAVAAQDKTPAKAIPGKKPVAVPSATPKTPKTTSGGSADPLGY
jgi:serine/threonine-protein kinase